MNQPEKKFSTGAICATIWKNESKEGNEFNTVTVERRFQDKEGNWKSTSSLRLNDLPKIAVVVNKAYEHLVLKEEAAA
tara:strand:- start:29 stop:262 length:234 start_codon:yes stop_codon:yes gene_type:complete